MWEASPGGEILLQLPTEVLLATLLWIIAERLGMFFSEKKVNLTDFVLSAISCSDINLPITVGHVFTKRTTLRILLTWSITFTAFQETMFWDY